MVLVVDDHDLVRHRYYRMLADIEGLRSGRPGRLR